MKLRFEEKDYQQQAIEAVTRCFQDAYDDRPEPVFTEAWMQPVTPNPAVDPEAACRNVVAIQEENGLVRYGAKPVFPFEATVEMETGTGKTYTYLRTIRALHAEHGFKKFIVVVPTVAIREGVLQAIRQTEEHLNGLYGTGFRHFVYSSGRLAQVGDFARSHEPTIMVINIDAFNKDKNLFRRKSELLNGARPQDVVARLRPVVILDEPQEMGSELAQAAIGSLRPTAILRYSATHRDKDTINLVYRLGPAEAYRRGLVKQIEVLSVHRNGGSEPYVEVIATEPGEKRHQAVIKLFCLDKKKGTVRVAKKTVSIGRRGCDLYKVSGGVTEYEGLYLSAIDADHGYVELSTGHRIREGEALGRTLYMVMREQVWNTVETHLDKMLFLQQRYGKKAPKVLSLLFIDRVDNYVGHEPRIKLWIEEAYNAMRNRAKYASLNLPPADKVHAGYFAQKRGKAADTGSNTKEANAAYAVIMQQKEKLLDPSNPIQFVVSHSALSRGWDCPNIFQLCMLRESHSVVGRRQEIGRGLRLAVDPSGVQVKDPDVNVLTVIAREGYAEFAQAIQSETYELTGDKVGKDYVKKATERVPARRRPTLPPEFEELWTVISQKTRYRCRVHPDVLVAEVRPRVLATLRKAGPTMRIERTRIKFDEEDRAQGVLISVEEAKSIPAEPSDAEGVPSLSREALYEKNLSFIVRKVWSSIPLARSTILSCLEGVDEEDTLERPYTVASALKEALSSVLLRIDLVAYQGEEEEADFAASYEFSPTEETVGADAIEEDESLFPVERMVFEQSCYTVSDKDKTVYDRYSVDADSEKLFARHFDESSDVVFWLKLPDNFRIPTPAGRYNPDWALILARREDYTGGNKRLRIVCESKSGDFTKLRRTEQLKCLFGKKHFEAIMRQHVGRLVGNRYIVSSSVEQFRRQVVTDDDGLP